MFDPALLASLFARRDEAHPLPPAESIHPVPVASPDPALRPLGEEALRRGEVAVLLVAGGQGTRLGLEQPKGMFPLGPLSGRTLFQIHAEKVLALSRRHGREVPFLVMTSPATHDETLAFFKAHKDFGLVQVEFFQQGTMPALDLSTGQTLMESPGVPCLSPDGHGGTLTALASSGLLARLRAQGVRHVFYFQVDNPLVDIADPVFLGHHIAQRAEVSSKVVAKRDAAERAGVFALVEGRHGIIEYSDLPIELAQATDQTGRLRLWAGNPAIHLFDAAFLERMTSDPEGLPLHVARKKVPHIGDPSPAEPNALKFERFIFDVLPKAERWLLLETERAEEFAPVKNAEGEDSPATARAAMLAKSARLIEAAGATGEAEVGPLFDLGRLRRGERVSGYLG